jgi:hypothetical protein
MQAISGGLGVNGTMMVIGAVGALTVNSLDLLGKRASVRGWYSGTAADSEDTLLFSQLNKIASMNEIFPLEEAQAAYDRMMSGKARFRVVLKCDDSVLEGLGFSPDNESYLFGPHIIATSHRHRRHKAEGCKRFHQWKQRNWPLFLVTKRCIHQNSHANRVCGVSKIAIDDPISAPIIPSGSVKNGEKVLHKSLTFGVAEYRQHNDLLSFVWRKSRRQRLLLLVRQSSRSLLFLKVRHLFVGCAKALLQHSNVRLAARLCGVCVALALSFSAAFCDSGQFVLTLPVLKGENFSAYQEGQNGDTGYLKNGMPSPNAIERIPPRIPSHDPLPWLLAIGAAFLAGFKLARIPSISMVPTSVKAALSTNTSAGVFLMYPAQIPAGKRICIATIKCSNTMVFSTVPIC